MARFGRGQPKRPALLTARLLALVSSWRNVAARYRLVAASWRNAQARYVLIARGWRNAQARYRIAATGWRQAQGRYRLVARGWRNVAARYVLAMQGPGTARVFLADAFPVLAFIADAFAVAVFVLDFNGGSTVNFVGKALLIANWQNTGMNPANPVTGGFRNRSGALYDPPSPALKYRIGAGVTQTISGGSLTHDGTGLYSATVTPTVDGDLIAVAVSGDGAYSDPQTTKIEPAPL